MQKYQLILNRLYVYLYTVACACIRVYCEVLSTMNLEIYIPPSRVPSYLWLLGL